ncbi:MAG: transposase [Bryobacterales bacterium]|nr:transposase [Bryobacterales bacterium]
MEQHGGQVLVRIKGNCGQTWETLTNLNWATGAERSWQEPHWQRSHNGPQTVSHSYGLTSLPAEAASAQQILELQRGHWQVESGNHYRRDVSLGEDRSRIRTGHGPANASALNNLALALLRSQRPQDTLPHAQTYYAGNRDEALQLLLHPCRPPDGR